MLISYEMFVDLLKRDHSYYVGNLANTGIKMYPSEQTFYDIGFELDESSVQTSA